MIEQRIVLGSRVVQSLGNLGLSARPMVQKRRAAQSNAARNEPAEGSFSHTVGPSAMSIDAESLIAHLANGLAPADRVAFGQAAENALATSPVCLGPGTIHRIVTSVWRTFFRPPREDRARTWSSGRKDLSKLIVDGAKDGHRRRRVIA